MSLRVFLCHSSIDKPKVRELYDRLFSDGVSSWFDEEDLLPGQDWDKEITKAVKSADVVIVCLSKRSVTKEGYVQKEMKLALDVADEKPEGTIYIIPLKLEECSVPNRLNRWQWVNWYEEDGYARLLMSLRERDKAIRALQSTKPDGAGVSTEINQIKISETQVNKRDKKVGNSSEVDLNKTVDSDVIVTASSVLGIIGEILGIIGIGIWESITDRKVLGVLGLIAFAATGSVIGMKIGGYSGGIVLGYSGGVAFYIGGCYIRIFRAGRPYRYPVWPLAILICPFVSFIAGYNGWLFGMARGGVSGAMVFCIFALCCSFALNWLIVLVMKMNMNGSLSGVLLSWLVVYTLRQSVINTNVYNVILYIIIIIVIMLLGILIDRKLRRWLYSVPERHMMARRPRPRL